MTKKRILIADDEEKTLFCISLAMKMKGYEIITVRNGEEALQSLMNMNLEGNMADLLICDIQMPKLSGEELIAKLKKLKINIPVLVITGFGNKDLLIRLMHLGCKDFFDKPFDSSEIQERVEMLLNAGQEERVEAKHDEELTLIGKNVLVLIHDLNNILTGTRGYADMIFEECKNSNAISEHVKGLISTTDLAFNICNQLLKLKNGDRASFKVTTDIRPLIERVVSLLRVIAPPAIEIRNSAGAQPIWIKANIERLQHALLNLGINSIQAMPDGGLLCFSASIAHLSKDDDSVSEPCLCIKISDTGVGISPENLSRILSESFTTKINGHGIGLSAVKTIMNEHKGWINITSEQKKGTEFQLFFPLGMKGS